MRDIIIPESKKTIKIPVYNKEYPLYIYQVQTEHKLDENEIYIYCPAAGLSQSYDSSDLIYLLDDVSDMIQEYQSTHKSEVFSFRLKPQQRIKLEKNAYQQGYSSVSEYVIENCAS